MMTFAFYLFAISACVAGFGVVIGRNPVHSVLWLILAFFSAAGLFVLQGAEFVAMLLVIVYVGAVAVLFLFVVMMLDVDFTAMRRGFTRYLPVGAAVSLVFLAELVFFEITHKIAVIAPAVPEVENTKAIGRVLYTDYLYPFLVSGFILLVAMIGAIVLTLRHKPDALRQDAGKQLARTRAETVRVVKVPTGSGVE